MDIEHDRKYFELRVHLNVPGKLFYSVVTSPVYLKLRQKKEKPPYPATINSRITTFRGKELICCWKQVLFVVTNCCLKDPRQWRHRSLGNTCLLLTARKQISWNNLNFLFTSFFERGSLSSLPFCWPWDIEWPTTDLRVSILDSHRFLPTHTCLYLSIFVFLFFFFAVFDCIQTVLGVIKQLMSLDLHFKAVVFNSSCWNYVYGLLHCLTLQVIL